ncbi:PIG-L deacetylase family protein [Profundibacterium mesophilum]|uniref:GlcNAc-PI de-N-acetylase domain containing protein n=1 Tax=Profundibacterium mesophilum KAUST100406-0324 TaxID=1037889 RepID=A0A921NUX2_9RHOB|nr:PIG-L family deacetylase [Profundibacterium mesophilum]KAF0676053.1 GlcNAc-PI de-N-acetylase domain containing protein [Profundibacterium mesophilum KAUST100406-0324]
MSPFLERAATAPQLAVVDLLKGWKSLAVIAPHPDDETLGCGALLHGALEMGIPCRVICMTDGSASHPNSRSHDRDSLAALRQRELRAALACLTPPGAAPIELIAPPWPDCGMPQRGEPAFEAGTAWLSGQVPQNAFVLCSWGKDPHVDHDRSATIAAAAACGRPDIALWHYPVWGRFGPAPAEDTRMHLLVADDAARAAKRRALACHASQMSGLIPDDPGGFVMHRDHQAHFLDHPEIVIAPA